MILIDTSVWIDHFRKENQRLVESLIAGTSCVHPFIIGELACGQFKNRKEALVAIFKLPKTEVINDNDLIRLINDNKLYGAGLGFVDVHILASAVLGGHELYTLDKRLNSFYQKLK